MPVISGPHELLESDIYLSLRSMTGRDLHLKCEGLNFAGSIKIRTAAGLLAAAERDGLIRPDSVLIESSSGNLGVAMSVLAAARGIPFVCVVDPRCNPTTVRLMRSLGARIVRVDEPDDNGGYLGSRLNYVRRRCAEDPRHVWLNQYENAASWQAHYDWTAPGIEKEIPGLDVLFVGAGTGGTVMGCARYFRDNGSRTRVVAVDAVGSVAFGCPPRTRLIPGLGSSVAPPLLDPELIDDAVHVSEPDTIRACRALAAAGILLGGSSGTVLSGALTWLARHDPDKRLRAVAIAPDMGERYAETIYDDEWVTANFGAEVLRRPFAAVTATTRSER